MKIILIAAIGKRGELGNGNRLPWGKPISADMKHFRELTLRKTVVMGRKTWESIPEAFRPLPDREMNIVLTRQLDFIAPGATVVHNIDDIKELAKTRDIYVIGGAEIYAALEPYASEMIITVVDGNFPATVYFPEYDKHAWREQFPHTSVPKDSHTNFALRFVRLHRLSPTA